METYIENNRWFQNARFGIFIHWGIYSLLERGEWVRFRESIPLKEYAKLADKFNPKKLNMDDWAALAKEAGAQYMVLTTRHHDGFCLFDSKASNFTSVKTKAKRDFVAEYVQACRKAELKVGFYYSLIDWQFLSFDRMQFSKEALNDMAEEVHLQVRELMTNYGKVDILWYDGAPLFCTDRTLEPIIWRSKELNDMVKQLQPHILINDRSSIPMDFVTPEQHATPPSDRKTLWESCMTVGTHWGFAREDEPLKSTSEIISILIKVARFGGNLLLNVGPKADGSISSPYKKRLLEVGEWLRHNGSSIYGSERTLISETPNPSVPLTTKGKKIFLHLSGKEQSSLLLPDFGTVKSVKAPGDVPCKLSVQKKNNSICVAGLETLKSKALKVIELEMQNVLDDVYVPEFLQEKPQPPDSLLEEFFISSKLLALEMSSKKSKIGLNVVHGKNMKNAIETLRSIDGVPVPGFKELKGIEGTPHNELRLIFSNYYGKAVKLKIGIIAEEKCTFSFELKADESTLQYKTTKTAQNLIKYKKNYQKELQYQAYPDAIMLENLDLPLGTFSLTIKAPSHFWVYALKLVYSFTAIPARCWSISGFTPSGWLPSSHNSQKLIKKSFRTKFVNANQLTKMVKNLELKQTISLPLNKLYDCFVRFLKELKIKEYGTGCASCFIYSPEPEKITIAVQSDWWAKVSLNGKYISTERSVKAGKEDGADFCGFSSTPKKIYLKTGWNSLIVKNHNGRTSNNFAVWLSDVADLKFAVNDKLKLKS
jgi:alpha-L-fucosidase